MAKAVIGKELLAKFFDESVYTSLFHSEESAVEAAFGSANGQPVYAVCQNGAALNAKDTDKMIKVIDMAATTGNPVVTFYNSIGAKLEEGLAALTSAQALVAAGAKVSGVIPQIAVVTGVCGASAALAAACADICVMSKDGELFLTPPFTSFANGDKMAAAGSAEYAAKAGVAHIVVEDAEAAAVKAAELVGILPSNNLSAPAVFEPQAPSEVLNCKDYCKCIAAKSIADGDSTIELYNAFGNSVYTAIATVAGNVVGIVSTSDNKEICHVAVSKAARFVRLCDSFSIPVITLLNTPGFVKSSGEDMSGGIREAARLAATYSDATTAKITVVTGNVYGTAFTAFSNADITIALEGCVIAPLAPQTAVTVLYKDELNAGTNIASDTQRLAAKYAQEVCSASAAVAAGVADAVATQETLRTTIVNMLDMLSTKRAQRLPKKHGNMAL